jgi:REP element-mobilizing transposase RayT
MNLELDHDLQAPVPGHAIAANRVHHIAVATACDLPIFSDARAAHAACRRFQDPVLLGDARMLAWVLMPDQVHWLLQLGESRSLQKTIGSLKVFSALDVNVALGLHRQVWKRGYQGRMLRGDEDTRAIGRDIIESPVRTGLVACLGAYPYWDAEWV